MQLNCPSCGAGFRFKARASVFGVCGFCSSMVLRTGVNLENLGQMAMLPPDLSPLQLGTRGRYEKRGFELVGRLRIGWQDGYWNEWFALFDDGREGWLGEAQGFLMMSFGVPDPGLLPVQADLEAGKILHLLGGRPFEVSDIKEATCIGSEGELPFRGAKGRKSTSVDLNGRESGFACLDYSEDGTRLYLGKYVEFDELSLTQLRQIDGW